MTVMSTLAACCAAVIAAIDEVAGIREFTARPPEINNIQDVTAFCFPVSGDIVESTEDRLLNEVLVTLYVVTPRQNFRTDWDAVIGLGDTVPRALLLDDTLGGVVTQISGIHWTFGGLEWAKQQGIGWTFEILLEVRGDTA